MIKSEFPITYKNYFLVRNNSNKHKTYYDETYLKPGRTEHFTEGRSFNEDIRWNNLVNVILKIKGVSHNGNEFDHTPYG